MAGHLSDIDLGQLSDRELLVLAVTHVNELASHVATQNGRVSKLEAWRNQAVGVLLVVSILASAAVSWAIGKL